LDIGVLGYIGIVQHKEHSPEVLHIPPGTPCIQLKSLFQCRDSVVGIATSLWIGRPGVRIPARAGDFSLLQNAQNCSG